MNQNVDKVVVYRNIPYNVLNDDLSGALKNDFFGELNEIQGYYDVYNSGAEFVTEGTNGDYVPSQLRYKKIRNLINKEARFMFSVPFDITVKVKGERTQESKEQSDILNEVVKAILKNNQFNSEMIKAGRDCFIGKRIAVITNFNGTSGITLTFLKSTEFYYEYEGNTLAKFIAFYVERDASNSSDRIIRKKSYMLQDGLCYITDQLYDGLGIVQETILNNVRTGLEYIPAVVIQNDGLLGDMQGESDVKELLDYEEQYSKFANTDLDALRKSMNATRYTIDASVESTKNLSTAPGAYWDIQSDENGVDQKTASIGLLEPSMSYSAPLATTLDRISQTMHAELSVPDLDNERLQGLITSGKTLKALYWPLVTRCNEKALVWIAGLESVIRHIIDGLLLYPNIAKMYNKNIPNVEYEVTIVNNYPLPEDEQEEKQIDMSEVSAQLMSRKAYMMKWRGLSEEEAQAELEQIVLEQRMLEESYSSDPFSDVENDIDALLE